MPNEKKENPKSIRWKWGFRLSIAFFLVYFVLSLLLLNQFQRSLYQQKEEEADRLLNNISDTLSQVDTKLTQANVESLFEKISVSTTTKGLMKVDNIPYLEDLKEQGITIRVFDSEGQLLYETQKSYTLFRRTPDFYLEATQLNSRDGFIGGKGIVSATNSILIGYVQVIFRLSDYHAILSQNNTQYMIYTVSALMISLLLGYILAIYFFRPIKNMIETMNQIKEDTLSDTRIKITNAKEKDELTELSLQINNLLDKMALYVSQQKQFVEDVSHELRTPTAIVEGHLKLLNRWGKEDPQVLDESLTASLSEIQRMKTLIQEMLDLSRAEQVEMHYKNEVTPIVGVLRQVHHNFQILYPDFNFFLDEDIASAEIYVNIYRNHFEQILVILLDNAVKYSTDRPEIHLSISEASTMVQIAIQDFGEGMSPEDQKRVFARFYRVDKARSRHKGGNGLGLSIAKELLEGYKGDITVESVLGYGSVFRIQLPILKNYHPDALTERAEA